MTLGGSAPLSTARRLHILAVTNLFPSSIDPGRAPFNRRQFASLARLADVEVVGVVPWRLGLGSERGLIREERIDSLRVVHRRYPSIPGLPSLNAMSMLVALLPGLRTQIRERPCDVLLASYAYPDGCAAVLLGRMIGVPVVVKCHGSDLNRVTDHPLVRVQLKRLLPRARAVVVVSRHLGDRALQLGVSAGRIHVVYNGIDHTRFRPVDKLDARRRLSLPLDREVVLYVGHLDVHKGVRDLLQALPLLWRARPRVLGVFLGRGPLSRELRAAATSQVSSPGSIIVSDAVPHDEIPWWMAAADVLCLPSWNEGMPNVIREAHACGRPVVATGVGGIPEAVCSTELGILVPPRQPAALADGLARQLGQPPVAPETIARLAMIPTWEDSARALYDVLDRAAPGADRT